MEALTGVIEMDYVVVKAHVLCYFYLSHDIEFIVWQANIKYS
jgi:hypothetical protein